MIIKHMKMIRLNSKEEPRRMDFGLFFFEISANRYRFEPFGGGNIFGIID